MTYLRYVQSQTKTLGKRKLFYSGNEKKMNLSFDLAPIRNHPKKNKEEFV